MEKFLGKYSDYIYAIMRIVVGLLFACNGARKLFGVFGGMGASGQAAPLFSQMGLAGTIEFFGGLLIALGLLTGTVAFIASGEMAVAYFQNHFPKGFWPILNTGERAVFYCFVFLYIASRGTVVWGLDRALRKRRRTFLRRA
ncbi:MAG: DoxX family protein [Deltaproteobacteria bacterium]|nr:DoxX family protein [Deltaproteobacteria bacterium]